MNYKERLNEDYGKFAESKGTSMAKTFECIVKGCEKSVNMDKPEDLPAEWGGLLLHERPSALSNRLEQYQGVLCDEHVKSLKGQLKIEV